MLQKLSKQPIKSLASDEAEGVGCVVIVLIIVGLLVFTFSGLTTRRNWYFTAFSKPLGPHGSYTAIAVKNFRAAQASFSPDSYTVTIYGTGRPDSNDKYLTGLASSSGTVYTVSCEPHFWNTCKPLAPEATYYARWVTPERTQVAISTLAKGKDGRLFVSQEEMQIYNVQSWEKQDTIQIATTEDLSGFFINGGLSFRYPRQWHLDNPTQGQSWQATLAPPEGHVGTWITHGMFVGFVASESSKVPQTLEHAFGECKSNFEKIGLEFIETTKTQKIVGDRQALMISYMQPSPLAVGERGSLIVIPDDSGYFYFLMFSPGDYQNDQYESVFNSILETVKIKPH